MSQVMRDALQQLAGEFARLETFLKKWDDQHHSEPTATRAKLKTECVVVLTENHGHFIMDQQDIVEHMRVKRDKLALELKNYTVLGENIQKLRSPDGLPS